MIRWMRWMMNSTDCGQAANRRSSVELCVRSSELELNFKLRTPNSELTTCFPDTTRLFAVAVDHWPLARQQRRNKLRNHTRIRRGWILARPEDIKVAERDGL